MFATEPPAALFWLRVGSGFADEAAFDKWRTDFERTTVKLETGPTRLSAQLPSGVALAAAPPFAQVQSLTPAPPRAVLELDGKDLGGPLLQQVEPLRSAAAVPEPAVLGVTAGKAFRWEAEAGRILPFFKSGADPKASGGKFVWVPGEPGLAGSSELGSVTWRLQLAAAGKFTLAARVRTPTPSDDSVRLRIFSAAAEPLPAMDWPLGVKREWAWTDLTDSATRRPQLLDLPAGDLTVEIRPREDGAMIDQLELKPAATTKPVR